MEDLLKSKAKALEYAPYTTSVFLIGWAFGGLFFGALGDRIGRARVLTLTILLYSLCTGLSCFSVGFWDFCAYRFLTGLGVGGVFGLAVALVADSVPEHRALPRWECFKSLSTVGNIIAGLLGMAIGALAAKMLLPFGLKAWQAMFLVGALPAMLCVLILWRVKEPETWVQPRSGEETGIKFGS